MKDALRLHAGHGPELLVVSDAIAATQTISFGPLASRGIGIAFWDERTHGKAVREGRASLDDVLARTAPKAVVLSRCVHPVSLDVLGWARRRGLAVVYHIDDDLLDVPDTLGLEKHAFYQDPARLRILRDAMQGSDLVYASTGPLAERLRAHGITTPVVAGDIYCSVDPETIRAALPAHVPVIGYMGSAGHQQDLAAIVPVIARLLDARPALSFELFGTITRPAALDRFGERVRWYAGFRDYDAFLARMRVMGWWIGLAPLEDNAFNRCKADTKWVEYTLAGCAVVAQDLPVYDRACADGCGLQAGPPEAWETALVRLLDDARLRGDMVRRAQARLVTHYAHDILVTQVCDILARLPLPGVPA